MVIRNQDSVVETSHQITMKSNFFFLSAMLFVTFDELNRLDCKRRTLISCTRHTHTKQVQNKNEIVPVLDRAITQVALSNLRSADAGKDRNFRQLMK